MIRYEYSFCKIWPVTGPAIAKVNIDVLIIVGSFDQNYIKQIEFEKCITQHVYFSQTCSRAMALIGVIRLPLHSVRTLHDGAML